MVITANQISRQKKLKKEELEQKRNYKKKEKMIQNAVGLKVFIIIG